MLTDAQISLIRSNWQAVAPIADEAGKLFYTRLLTDNPQLKPMFAHTDMAQQRMKLTTTLGLVVKSIDKVDSLLPVLRLLGRSHVGYGVETKHYAMVAKALIDTLQQALGPGFTAEAKAAWSTALEFIAGVMLEGAAQA